MSYVLCVSQGSVELGDTEPVLLRAKHLAKYAFVMFCHLHLHSIRQAYLIEFEYDGKILYVFGHACHILLYTLKIEILSHGKDFI